MRALTAKNVSDNHDVVQVNAVTIDLGQHKTITYYENASKTRSFHTAARHYIEDSLSGKIYEFVDRYSSDQI